MINRKKIYFLLLIPFLSMGFIVYQSSDIYFEVSKNLEVFTKVYREVTLNYVDDINPEEFLRSGIKGMLQNLDPYNVFIDEKRQDDIELMTTGKYGGVGISVGLREDKITIIEIMDGYSAQLQGLNIGDEIISVDSVSLNKTKFEDVSLYVKGEPGTSVSLRIVRPGIIDTLQFNLLREEIHVKNVSFAGFVPANSTNAYIKLTGFNRGAGEELRRAILNLQKTEVIKSLVLDLRGNPGGLLESAVDISSVFLPKGALIVATMGRDSSSYKAYHSVKEPLVPDISMAVLVNGNSASASEIVAGAIQDHDRGIIIGDKTFGKGLVQTISPLTNNTSLKITTSKYYTPSGRCIQKIDYAKDNKVVMPTTNSLPTVYTTDNQREVLSAGGITPDSIVLAKEYSDYTKDLLAKGYVFRITTHILSKYPDRVFTDSDIDYLKKQFADYLTKDKYSYKSEISKKIEELQTSFQKNDEFASVKSDFEAFASKLKKVEQNTTVEFPEDALYEILGDLTNRKKGSSEKIKFLLQRDKQFLTGIKLLNDKKYLQSKLNNK